MINKLSVFLLAVSSTLYADELIKSQPLESYQKSPEVGGSLLSAGSDTLAGMTTLWIEAFQEYYPNINAQVQASGSSTAPPALIEGTAQLGPMSRAMRNSEIESFEQTYGYKPTQLRVAIDAIGIFVQKDNPIAGLNFIQLDQVFSATLRCGGVHGISTWQDLGVEASWSKRSIQMFGRNSVSGTYGYFKQNVLCNGDFKKDVNEQPGSASVVQSVASSINSIGYSGIGYSVSGVRLLPIAEEGNKFVTPSHENIISGAYPLSRYLYIYINKKPGQALSPMLREFIRFIYSQEGQLLVEKEGYVPVSVDIARDELAKVGIRD